MNKLYHLIKVFSALLLLSVPVAAQTPEYFYDQGNTASNSIPLGGGTWADQRNQWLYPPGDFGNVPGGRAISKIYLQTGGGTYAAASYTNFTVRLGQPTNLSGGLPGTWITGLATVFSASTFNVPATVPREWFAIELDVPFAYDPNLPLVVETIQTGTTGSKPLSAGGIPINTAWTGNTQAYGASGAATPTSRRYSYSLGFDMITLAPINAGARAITEPSNFCPGTYMVKAQIQNLGTLPLDSVRVSWSLDNVFQNTIYYTQLLDTFGGAGNNSDIVNLGNVTWNSGQTRVIKAWTSYPNGIMDTTNRDDTATASLKPALSGTFSVGGAGADYPDLASAANDLSANGICGPVVLNVAPGTYTQQVSFRDVAGSSAINTIQVLGSGINSTILSFNPTSTPNQHVLQISNTSYVTVKNMSIRSTSATAAFGVHITGEAHYNLIDSCEITVNTTSTSTVFQGVTISGATYSAATNASYNTISNCTITGGYNGVSMYGNSGSQGRYNQVLNNVINNSYYAGIWIYFQSYCIADGNRVNARFTTNSYGGYFYYMSDSAVVKNNYFYSRYMGIYLSQIGTAGTMRGYVYNNITTGHNNATSYNFYMATCNRTDLFNNSGILQTTGGASLYVSGGSGNRVFNNIFAKSQTNGLIGQVVSPGALSFMDYNNMWSSSGGNYMNWGGQVYTQLGDLAGADPLYNQNSVNENPNWVNITPGIEDLHISSSLPSPRGVNLVVLDRDIDGDSRCEFAPTIGADENTSSLPAPIANFGVLDTLFTGSLGTVVSTSFITPGDLVAYHWYLDGVEIGNQSTLRYSFPSAGTYDITLLVNSCGSADSITKQVTVVDATALPTAAFNATRLILDPLQSTVLTDISSGGPNTWEWNIQPDFGVLMTDQFGPINEVSFIDPGEYEVCLSVGNDNGQGTDACKPAYIFVRESFWFCSANTVTAKAGRLFDEGGPNSNYQANINCGLLIDPCASTVNLKFNSFTVADAGDILYIYDGADDQSGTLIGAYSNTSGIPGGNVGLTANSGRMFLRWVTNASGNASGFDAEWTSIGASVAAPVADFEFPAVTYTGEIITFNSTSTGDYLSYNWDFDPPMQDGGLDGGKAASARYTFSRSGVYPVELTISNCAGTDVLTQNVNIVDPTSTPIVGFEASVTQSKVERYITFTDTSDMGPNNWFWRITPNSGVFFKNNVRNQKQVEAIFYRPGFYNVELVVGNIIGKDSLVKSNYIEIIDYCSPAVNALNSDAGISLVEFAGMSNRSNIGEAPYTNYSETVAAPKVEQGKWYNFRIERITTIDDMSRKIWIDWNNNTSFTDAGEEVASEASARTQAFSGSIYIPRTATPGLTRMRVATSYRGGQNAPCGINPTGEFEDYLIEIIPDVIAPVVTLAGPDTVFVEQWHSYQEPGFSAMDNIDGNITTAVIINSNFDSSVVGTYQVRYLVVDTAGNSSAERVRYIVVTPDVTDPILTLQGANPDKLTVFMQYIEPGYDAIDFDNRIITSSVVVQNNINENVLGTYTIDYSVDDGSGNVVAAQRLVEVLDDVAPLVVFTDPINPLVMNVNTPFVEPGVSISDNYDNAPVLTTSGLDITKTGTYQLVYIGTDSSGNVSAPLVRTVIVQDTVAPEIALIGGDTVLVHVFSSYIDRGFIATDNYCQNLQVRVTGQVNTNVVGEYLLTYNLTDCEGNQAIPRTRLVRVVDLQAPVIQLIGLPNITIARWEGFNDPGVSISDNYYDETTLQGLLQVITNLDENWEGEYEYCYQVTDPSGNRSQRICRNVTVTENITSVNGVNEGVMLVYPNPSRGIVKVEVSEDKNPLKMLEVIDLHGKVIVQMTPELWKANNHQLNLSGFASGVYVIRYIGSQATWNHKVELH